MSNNRWIGLLRGINVGGHNKIPMAGLRQVCSDLGWADVESYIQSGNLVFSAAGSAAELEFRLEKALAVYFNLSIPVIVRNAADWPSLRASNPFPEAAEREPHLLLMGLTKAPLLPDAAALLQARAADGEHVAQTEQALWIHFPNGSGRSKLTPGLMDRLAGSPVTTRNWRTVLKLEEMIG